jgi:hypothetical protein
MTRAHKQRTIRFANYEAVESMNTPPAHDAQHEDWAEARATHGGGSFETRAQWLLWMLGPAEAAQEGAQGRGAGTS